MWEDICIWDSLSYVSIRHFSPASRISGSVETKVMKGGKVSKAESKNRCCYHVFLLLSKKGAMLLPIERLKEGNSKCRHLKNSIVKGLCGRCLSV
jgi:hypothetical protein